MPYIPFDGHDLCQSKAKGVGTWIIYCLKWMLEMVLICCVHSCFACCALSDSYTSVSINSAKWPSQLITDNFKDIKAEIPFCNQKQHFWKLKCWNCWKSLQYQEFGKGLNDSVMMRKPRPATAWGKWRWNCKDLRKKNLPTQKKTEMSKVLLLLITEKGKAPENYADWSSFYDSMCLAFLQCRCHPVTAEKQLAYLCPQLAMQKFSIMAV